MTECIRIGEVDVKKHKRIYEDTHAEWRIAEFFLVTEYNDSKYYDSPTFPVAGETFFFRLYPRKRSHPEWACIYLNSKRHRNFSIEYNIGLKKLDDSVEQLNGGIMNGDESYCSQSGNVIISEILRRKSELCSNNVLTFTCTVKPETLHSSETTEMEKTKVLKLIRLDKLSENLKDLFGDKATCDTTLKVKDREYKAHRLILMARSTVFAATFKHDTLERQTGVITISDCDPDSFQLFLDYLYRGQLEELTFLNALNLYYISNKYDVEELKVFCVKYLMHCLTVENICEIVVFADKYKEMELFSAIQNFFNKNYFAILLTTEWDNLLATDHRLANKLLKEMSKSKV